MANHRSIALVIGFAILLSAGALADNATFSYYCPHIACVNDSFVVWAEYFYNGTVITNATVTAGAFPLTYNPTYETYRSNFTLNATGTSNYTITAIGSYGNFSANCSTQVLVCYNLTIKLWQEKAYETYAQTSQYAVKVRNYDKQLDTPYINDFAWIIARNEDHRVPGLNNQSCNVPTGPGQKFLEILNLGNWMGNSATQSIIDLIGDGIGCDRYWFRGEYTDGVAVLRLPWRGNYSLWLLDGVIMWQGEYTPPDIVKSNLFLPIGNEDIPQTIDYTDNFWIPRKDFDFWGPFTDFFFVPLLLIGVFIFFALIFLGGISMIRALGVMLIWFALWTFIRMLG